VRLKEIERSGQRRRSSFSLATMGARGQTEGRDDAEAGHLPEEQRKILRAVALAYRRVMREPEEPAGPEPRKRGWRRSVRMRR
jgi:hypothetical protein